MMFIIVEKNKKSIFYSINVLLVTFHEPLLCYFTRFWNVVSLLFYEFNFGIYSSWPRQAGIDAPGTLQHSIIRGIERKAIFRNDTDRDDFTDRLGNLLQETQTACYAWAFMTHHPP
jgi:hypothetical protein